VTATRLPGHHDPGHHDAEGGGGARAAELTPPEGVARVRPAPVEPAVREPVVDHAVPRDPGGEGVVGAPAGPEPADRPAGRPGVLAGTVPPAQPWGHRLRVLSVAAAREALRDRALLAGVLLLPLALAGVVVLVAQAVAPRDALDVTRWVLPGSCAAGLVVLALTGTAGRLLRLRARGVVLLTALCPAGRWAALLAATPVRVGLAVAQLLVTAVLCAAAGVLAPRGAAGVAGLLVTDVLGALLAVAVGALVGGLARAVDSAHGLLALATGVVLLLGGVLVPLSALPAPAADVLALTPTALLSDALRSGLTGTATGYPLAVTWLVLAVATALTWVATVATLRLGARRPAVPDAPAPPFDPAWD